MSKNKSGYPEILGTVEEKTIKRKKTKKPVKIGVFKKEGSKHLADASSIIEARKKENLEKKAQESIVDIEGLKNVKKVLAKYLHAGAQEEVKAWNLFKLSFVKEKIYADMVYEIITESYEEENIDKSKIGKLMAELLLLQYYKPLKEINERLDKEANRKANFFRRKVEPSDELKSLWNGLKGHINSNKSVFIRNIEAINSLKTQLLLMFPNEAPELVKELSKLYDQLNNKGVKKVLSATIEEIQKLKSIEEIELYKQGIETVLSLKPKGKFNTELKEINKLLHWNKLIYSISREHVEGQNILQKQDFEMLPNIQYLVDLIKASMTNSTANNTVLQDIKRQVKKQYNAAWYSIYIEFKFSKEVKDIVDFDKVKSQSQGLENEMSYILQALNLDLNDQTMNVENLTELLVKLQNIKTKEYVIQSSVKILENKISNLIEHQLSNIENSAQKIHTIFTLVNKTQQTFWLRHITVENFTSLTEENMTKAWNNLKKLSQQKDNEVAKKILIQLYKGYFENLQIVQAVYEKHEKDPYNPIWKETFHLLQRCEQMLGLESIQDLLLIEKLLRAIRNFLEDIKAFFSELPSNDALESMKSYHALNKVYNELEKVHSESIENNKSTKQQESDNGSRWRDSELNRKSSQSKAGRS